METTMGEIVRATVEELGGDFDSMSESELADFVDMADARGLLFPAQTKALDKIMGSGTTLYDNAVERGDIVDGRKRPHRATFHVNGKDIYVFPEEIVFDYVDRINPKWEVRFTAEMQDFIDRYEYSGLSIALTTIAQNHKHYARQPRAIFVNTVLSLIGVSPKGIRGFYKDFDVDNEELWEPFITFSPAIGDLEGKGK